MKRILGWLPSVRCVRQHIDLEFQLAEEVDNTRNARNLADSILSDLDTYLLEEAPRKDDALIAARVRHVQQQRTAVLEAQSRLGSLEQKQRRLLAQYVRSEKRILWVKITCWTSWLVCVAVGWLRVSARSENVVVTVAIFVAALVCILIDIVHTVVSKRRLRDTERLVRKEANEIFEAYSRSIDTRNIP